MHVQMYKVHVLHTYVNTSVGIVITEIAEHVIPKNFFWTLNRVKFL